MNRPVIVARSVNKSFSIHTANSVKERFTDFFARRNRVDRFEAVKDVSFEIFAGETVGLVGHNGSGKSTLLKLLGGIVEPSSGEVLVGGRVAALLELGAGFHPDLTGRENIYLNAAVLGLSETTVDRLFDDIVDFSGLEQQFIDQQVKFYSSGMYVRLAFAVAVHSDPEILLVDEVLAVGDEPFQAKCMAKIRQFQSEGKTILFVSHSSGQVAEICSRVIVMDHGDAIFDGDVALGLRALRNTFQEAREAHGAELPTGELRAEIISVEATRFDGEPFEFLTPNDDLRIAVTVLVRDKISFVSGFTLTDPTGQVLYWANSAGFFEGELSGPGRFELVFLVPAANINTDRVIVSAGVTNSMGILLHDLTYATEFSVRVDSRSGGPMRFATQLAVEQLD